MTFGKPSPWTDERIALLKKLWSEGLSTRLIAAELGGMPRNTVCGKVHRLGLPKRPSPIRKKAEPTPKAERLILPPPLKPDNHPTQVRTIKRVKESKPVTIWDVQPGQCRWPNDGSVLDGTFRYCGAKAPQWPACLYCATHMRMAWARTIERARAA